MEKKILVTYASKYGATKEIGEKIGEVLRGSGLSADVLPVDGMRDLNAYTAVILGSAIFIGKWPKGAVKFLETNEKALSDRPVWLFSSGPTGEGNPVELVEGVRVPAELQPIVDRIQPRDVTVFHGFIDPEKISFVEKLAIKAIKKPMGDFRDWNGIVTWANSVARELKEMKA